jgi:predicted RecB family endonuclease
MNTQHCAIKSLPTSAVVLEDMVLVSRRLEDLKKGLGLGLDKIVLVLVLVLKKGLVDSTAAQSVNPA